MLLFSQVGCKAIVCLTQFKTQKYCDMLRQICPEIETSTPGDIRSARYSRWCSPVICHWSYLFLIFYMFKLWSNAKHICKCQLWHLSNFCTRPLKTLKSCPVKKRVYIQSNKNYTWRVFKKLILIFFQNKSSATTESGVN